MKIRFSLLCLLLPAILFGQVSSFSFNINGAVPPGFASALEIAGQKWSKYLQIQVPVKVNVFTVNSSFYPFSGITIANGRKNFLNRPYPDYLYVTSLANQLAGSELNPGEYDMDIYFNLASNFYFGSGHPGANLDFISTAMHEIGHGLGFYSDGYVDANGNGSFGNIPLAALIVLVPSFPWHGLDGVPTIYDKYIVRTSGNLLTNCGPQNSLQLGDSIETGPLYFSGPAYANPAHSNTPVRLAAGSGAFSLGVDLLHIHESYPNTIMSYYWTSGDTSRIPAPWEIGMLKEIGWNRGPVGIQENHGGSASANVYPNPASSDLVISGENLREAKLLSVLGKVLQTQAVSINGIELNMNVEDLSEGVYFIEISYEGNHPSQIKKVAVRH